MIPLLLMLAADATPPTWAEFSRGVALTHVTERIEIATDRVTEANVYDYRLTYSRETLADKQTVTVTSRECPAVRRVVESMRGIQMPQPAPIGVGAQYGEIILDGAGYMLRMPTNFSNGEMTLSSNVNSPLAKWIDGAFDALGSCWASPAGPATKR